LGKNFRKPQGGFFGLTLYTEALTIVDNRPGSVCGNTRSP